MKAKKKGGESSGLDSDGKKNLVFFSLSLFFFFFFFTFLFFSLFLSSSWRATEEASPLAAAASR